MSIASCAVTAASPGSRRAGGAATSHKQLLVPTARMLNGSVAHGVRRHPPRRATVSIGGRVRHAVNADGTREEENERGTRSPYE